MIKHKQPRKNWVDDGTEFLGAFKALCNKRGLHLCSRFSCKNSAFAERNIRSLKNIICRYLEEKWTYWYLDKLDSFVKTINSRVNRTIKLAPNKVTKKTFRGLYRWLRIQHFLNNQKFLFVILYEYRKKRTRLEKVTNSFLLTSFLKIHLSQHWTLRRILLLIPIRKLFRVYSINPNCN